MEKGILHSPFLAYLHGFPSTLNRLAEKDVLSIAKELTLHVFHSVRANQIWRRTNAGNFISRISERWPNDPTKYLLKPDIRGFHSPINAAPQFLYKRTP